MAATGTHQPKRRIFAATVVGLPLAVLGWFVFGGGYGGTSEIFQKRSVSDYCTERRKGGLAGKPRILEWAW